MDLYHFSDPGQPQSTQILDELIENELKKALGGLDSQTPSKSNSSGSTETSDASYPAATNFAPAYNLYGLNTADPEAQNDEEEEEQDINDGSQKENIGASSSKNENGRTPNQPSATRVLKTPAAAGRQSPMKSNKKDKGTYVVSNHGSSKKATMNPYKPNPSTRYKPRSRPRSDSQDSFAQDPIEDIERNLLVQSEQFALPLDQLSKKAQLDRGNFASGSATGKMYSNAHMGKVLVASTPSQSNTDESQSQPPLDPRQLAQRMEATDLVETQPADDMNVDDGYESSEPNSSYGRILDGEDSEGGAEDVVPTQPSTQLDIPSEPAPMSYGRSTAVVTTASSVPRTLPKSLWETVPPQNRHRYNINGQHHPEPGLPAQETQPSHDVPSTRGVIPTTNLNTRDAQIQSLIPPQNESRRTRFSSPPPSDGMDIVPDSEPAREHEGVHPITTATTTKLAKSKANPQAMVVDSPRHKQPEKDAEEAEKMEEDEKEPEEEEEEVSEEEPLAQISAARHKNSAAAKAAPNKAKGKGKMKETLPPADPSPRNTRSGKNNRSGKAQAPGRRNPRSNEYVPSSVPEQDFSSMSSRNAKTGGKEDEEQHEETEDVAKDSGPANKRKCPATKPAAPPVPKRPKNAKKLTPAPIRNLRSAISTSQKVGSPPSRVFALSKGHGHWLLATVHAPAATNTKYSDTYIVKFSTGGEETVSVHNMRQGFLVAGDEVIPTGHTRSCRVVESIDQTTDSVTLDVDGHLKEYALSNIKIACASMRKGWEKRRIDEADLVYLKDPGKLNGTPTPSRPALLSQRAGSASSLLKHTGLIITLTVDQGKYEKQKAEILEAVDSSGGSVIEDLSTIVKMDGQFAVSNNRWTIRKEDVSWKNVPEINRLFLIADECNQKPKYLLALALGIPCLSQAWLRDTVEEGMEKEWASYLLPQGFSVYLGCRPSQQVDMDWGISRHHIEDIMNNRVPAKVFDGKYILCVGTEMLPPTNARKKLQDTGNAVPRIILAMGAKTVEVVGSTQYASRSLASYDYVVIRDNTYYTADMEHATTVEWTWVKECLIASRLVPHEEAEEYSQEA